MALSDIFRRWSRKRERANHDRVFRATQILMLGMYQFDSLAEADQKRVESTVLGMMTGEAAELKSLYQQSWISAATYRALAMAKLGMAPIGNLCWAHLLQGWDPVLPAPRAWPIDAARAVAIISEFRDMHPAVEEAKSALRAQGLDIPDVGPWSISTLDGQVLGPGEDSEWRKRLREAKPTSKA